MTGLAKAYGHLCKEEYTIVVKTHLKTMILFLTLQTNSNRCVCSLVLIIYLLAQSGHFVQYRTMNYFYILFLKYYILLHIQINPKKNFYFLLKIKEDIK